MMFRVTKTVSAHGCTDLPDEEGTETVLAEAARSFLGREKLRRTLRGMMQGDIRLLPRNKRPTGKGAARNRPWC